MRPSIAIGGYICRVQRIRSYLMPVAIVLGIMLPGAHILSPLMPWLIVTMMFLSFVGGVPGQEPGSTRWVAVRVALGSLFFASLVWSLGRLLHWPAPMVMAGLLLCLAPPANASPAMTKLLGGNPLLMLKLVVGGHFIACITIPLLAAWFQGTSPASAWNIAQKVFLSILPLVVLPIGSATLLRHALPAIAARIAKLSAYTMLLWTLMVFVVISAASHNIRALLDAGQFTLPGLVAVGALSLAIAIALFASGWKLGGTRYPIESSQGLGQKNTVLMIWIAQAYIHPVAALGPVCYVVWQNLILSYMSKKLKVQK
jgi:bile acid:Na+ symporter, BASS family